MQSLQNERASFRMTLYMYKNHWRYFQRPKVIAFVRQCGRNIHQGLSPAIKGVGVFAGKLSLVGKLNLRLPKWKISSPWIMSLLLVITASITGSTTAAEASEGSVETYSWLQISESAQSLTTGKYEMPSVDRDSIYKPKMIWPVGRVEITSTFGWREAPCATCSSDHEGLDMTPGEGAEIHSAMAGTVVSFGWDGGMGYDIVISDDHGWKLYYGHMIPNSVPSGIVVGSQVSKGQVIGRVGCTGACTGPHLHFGIFDMYANQFIDPLPQLQRYAS
jgi:murein DD-endopeptidase MepM/ murein hydrolase activator NlpD